MVNAACGGHNNPMLLDPTELSLPFSRSLKHARKNKEKEKRAYRIKINLT